MSFALKRLYDGQLPVTKTSLYAAGAGQATKVHTIVVINTDSVARKFILFFKKSGGTSRKLVERTIEPQYTSVWDGEEAPLLLEAGDAIEGQSPDGATIFDVTMTGYVETLTIPI